jgi:adenine-specific DNA glycosylase
VRYELASHLMDLGHYVCTARLPKCGTCPIRAWCEEGQVQPCLPFSFDIASFGKEGT